MRIDVFLSPFWNVRTKVKGSTHFLESVNWSISLDQTTKNLYGPKYPK